MRGVVLVQRGREDPEVELPRGSHPPLAQIRRPESCLLGHPRRHGYTRTRRALLPRRAPSEGHEGCGVPDELADDAVARIGEAYVPWQETGFRGLLGNVVAGGSQSPRLTARIVSWTRPVPPRSRRSGGVELAAGRSDVARDRRGGHVQPHSCSCAFRRLPAATAHRSRSTRTVTGRSSARASARSSDGPTATRQATSFPCLVKAVGTSSDGKGNAIYAPSADGLTNAYCARGHYAGHHRTRRGPRHGHEKPATASRARAPTHVYGKARDEGRPVVCSSVPWKSGADWVTEGRRGRGRSSRPPSPCTTKASPRPRFGSPYQPLCAVGLAVLRQQLPAPP